MKFKRILFQYRPFQVGAMLKVMLYHMDRDTIASGVRVAQGHRMRHKMEVTWRLWCSCQMKWRLWAIWSHLWTRDLRLRVNQNLNQYRYRHNDYVMRLWIGNCRVAFQISIYRQLFRLFTLIYLRCCLCGFHIGRCFCELTVLFSLIH